MAEAPKEQEKETQEATESTGEATESAEGGENAEHAPSGKKKKLILIGSIAAALLLAIPTALHFTGVLHLFGAKKEAASGEKATDKEHGAEAKSDSNLPSPPVTFDLDEFLVNLDTPGKQARFLKMTIALELPSEEEKEAIKPYVPRIRDTFQLYLRELREDDVKGSAALYRLREELMLRLSKVVYPIKVNDILFKEILTQ